MMGSKGRPIWMDVESGSGLLKAAILSSRSRSAQSTVRAQIHAALSTPWVARTVSTLMWRDSTAPPASANRVIDSMIRFSPVAGIACTLAMSSRLYLAVFKPPSVSAAAFISEPLDREMLTPPMPCSLPVSQLQGEGYSPLHVLLYGGVEVERLKVGNVRSSIRRHVPQLPLIVDPVIRHLERPAVREH